MARIAALGICLPICALLSAPAAAAQDPGEPETRAELLLRQRQAKQGRLTPPEPTGLEHGLDIAENRVVPVLQRDGIYAKFGSLTTGSGFAYGGGYRDRSLVDGLGSVNLWAAASFKRYWALEARARYPLAPGDRVFIEGYARRFGYPSEEFFGAGPDSRRADRSIYRLHGVTAGGRAWVEATDELSFGGGLELMTPEVRGGRHGSLPSVDDRFDAVQAPGQRMQHRFVRASGQVVFDYRQPLNARKGGYYQFDVSRYADRRGAGAFSFTRADLDLRQYVSFLAERRVLAARALVSTTDVEDGAVVPFFLLPALGGNDTLRGFRAHRFRGPHALLLQGEYRWEIWSGLEAALFVDAGKVANRRADLTLRDLERDYGFGFRFNTDNGVIMRVDAAFGSRDGRHFHVVFGGTF